MKDLQEAKIKVRKAEKGFIPAAISIQEGAEVVEGAALESHILGMSHCGSLIPIY